MAPASEIEKRKKSIFKTQPELLNITSDINLKINDDNAFNIKEKILDSSSEITCAIYKKDLK